ncbi:hypothetical protein N7491_011135 [Penicillium cf. griseofulvum]|uniref:Uncharacterized protein n=1 Tax=Penicillium cf. griseofulvum TaxID=2972120 RepID=A0A9W9N142_9EURO|nr:hypothetical protein N7472_001454 [Penicillium cf. griseofulvum]KAJ5422690.1 hypothetical protein N7491_011135 [Penicillium cf. griseofulvum]KAJ5428865.1 hypothetical protein N7445_010319 [Penicillium cf. griseofulvum]
MSAEKEKTQDEMTIESSGDIDALQRYRRNLINRGWPYVGRAVELLRVEEDRSPKSYTGRTMPLQ